ncbi:MAG: M13 family peptidase, partial [Alphaproteobacteria bacterium]|nr:M13 family peptidase [Alphaproteobacteria bacterium]
MKPITARVAALSAFGSVIAHEVSHAFDDSGAQYDAHGALRDWWSASDRKHFEVAAARLKASYAALDASVDQDLTIGENLA